MGKMSDLDLQIKELRSCGETIIGIANTLAGMFSSQATEDAPPKEKPKALTLEEVRHRMTVIAQAGYSAEVKALITKYGARKLSDIDPSKFEGLLKEADALGKPGAGNDGEAFLPFHRWINCPPSARLCEEYADRPSEYAQEGTDCHELCAYKVEKALGRRVKDPTENLTYYSQEMEDCADGYCAFVMEEVAKARERCADPLVLVEQRLDYSRYVGIEGSFGTGDCVIVSDGLLHIIDYKHGLGVLVSAEKNSQLSCYALGALDLFDGIYDIAQVSLTIYQPRRENVSTYTMSREDLLAWAETVLAPAAKLAYEGKGEFKAGGHCQFCKAKANCRKRAEYNLELARYDFEMPALLGDDEVAAILVKADELVSWAGDVKDYALQKALSGTKFTGFKVVEGRSNRKYTDEAAVAKAVEAAGYEPYEKKLLGITAMSQALGRKKFEDLLGGLLYKPPGKPVLVPESDKRPAMNTAINDFKGNKEDNNYGKDRK